MNDTIYVKKYNDIDNYISKVVSIISVTDAVVLTINYSSFSPTSKFG